MSFAHHQPRNLDYVHTMAPRPSAPPMELHPFDTRGTQDASTKETSGFNPRAYVSKKCMIISGVVALVVILLAIVIPVGVIASQSAGDVEDIEAQVDAQVAKIIGGTALQNTTEAPWFVFVESSNTDVAPDCGGVLVGNCHVLTAAHCVEFAAPKRVVVNAYKRDVGSIANDVHISSVTETPIMHPLFDTDSHAYDIALLRMSKCIAYKDMGKFPPIEIPTSHDGPKAGRPLRVYGLGATNAVDNSADARYPNTLQRATIPVVSTQNCAAEYQRNNIPLAVSKDHSLCAGDVSDNVCRGSSQVGDMGGPLVGFTKRGNPSLKGIMSVGVACSKNVPALYTSVSASFDWVRDIVCDDSQTFLYMPICKHKIYCDIESFKKGSRACIVNLLAYKLVLSKRGVA